MKDRSLTRPGDRDERLCSAKNDQPELVHIPDVISAQGSAALVLMGALATAIGVVLGAGIARGSFGGK